MIALLRDVWSKDASSYPSSGPATGLFGFRMKLKCSICILLGRRGRESDSCNSVPVYVSPWFSYHGYDGPGASWSEIAVDVGWKRWRYYEYQNGI